MTYQNFKELIQNMVQDALGSAYQVNMQSITKNNNTRLDGLTILTDELNISPTIYLNHYYRQYEHGKTAEQICEEILAIYRDNCPASNIDISFFTDYDKLKDHIIFKLVHYERNKNLLECVPHIRVLDLALVFCCLVDASPSGTATILIYNQHLQLWHLDRDTLYQLATKNTPVLLPYEIRDMSDVISDLFSNTESFSAAESFSDIVPMYVLSNRTKLNGSACMLYHSLLHDFANTIDSDLYLLPSSVHEVLILPTYIENTPQELSDIVKEVNDTQLTKEEILSDHVYLYSRETGQITMPAD